MAKKSTKRRTAKKKTATKRSTKKSTNSSATTSSSSPSRSSGDEVNKSQAIRDLMSSNPRLKPADISAKLKERGIDVSPQYVSTIKSNQKKTKKKRGRKPSAERAASAASPGRPKSKSSEDVSVGELMEAKKLVEQMGGVDKARRALEVLSKLQ